MTCPACAEAKERPSGRFQMGCRGCIARGVSRYINFRESQQQGRLTAERSALRAARTASGTKFQDVLQQYGFKPGDVSAVETRLAAARLCFEFQVKRIEFVGI